MEKQAKAQDQVAMPSSQIKQHDEASKRESETNDIADRGQEARFGFTNIGGTGSVSIESDFSLPVSFVFYRYLYFLGILLHFFFSIPRFYRKFYKIFFKKLL